MLSQPPIPLVDPPTADDPEEGWAALDAELARWLRMRSSHRASRDRDPSPLDGVAIDLRRVRATLAAMGEAAMSAPTTTGEASVTKLVSRAYRWTIRVARELRSIEELELDPMLEWARFEAFAPFGLAFFDTALAGIFAAVESTEDTERLRRELHAVRAPLAVAMTSSAWAA